MGKYSRYLQLQYSKLATLFTTKYQIPFYRTPAGGLRANRQNGTPSENCTQTVSVPCNKDNERIQDEKLLEPYAYFVQQQVPMHYNFFKLTTPFNYWLNIPTEKFDKIADILKMLLNSILILDDVLGRSTIRGSLPVTHRIYGVPRTIVAANYVHLIILERVLDLQHPDAVSVYSEELRNFQRGQGMNIYWRDSFICPSEDEYREMVLRKTGSLYILIVKLMQLFSDSKADYTKLAGILGVYLQIHNDFENIYYPEDYARKTYCEDLTEGKFSFPVIHAINSRPKQKDVFNILRQRTADYETKKYCRSLLENFGSFEYTKKVLTQLNHDARDEARKLGRNPVMDDTLEHLFKIK